MEDPDEYLRAKPRLTWEKDDDRFAAFRERVSRGLADHGIERDAAALVVTAHTGYLKIVSTLVYHLVSDLDGLERESVFDGAERLKALRASTHGATVTAHLSLIKNIEPMPLRPWRKGTWLAKATFRIQTDTARQLFQPTPMDDETRNEFHLPKDCVCYVHMDPHDPLRPYLETSAPVFYVDADILTRLDRAAGSAVGRAMQAQLARDFVAGVIMDVAAQRAEASLSWDDIEGSLFGRIVAMVSGKGSSVAARQQMIELVRNDPSRLLSQVEGALKLQPSVVQSLSADE